MMDDWIYIESERIWNEEFILAVLDTKLKVCIAAMFVIFT